MAALLVSLAHVAGVGAQADRPSTVQLNDDVPMTYTVKKGDTLWDISEIYLREPWRWPELWDNNPQIDNPHLIYPGDVLELRWENGRPRLGLARRGDIKLSPQIRSQALSTASPPIPRDQIDPFLRGHRIVDPDDFAQAPYIIAGDAERLISGLGDRVYARGPMLAADRTHIVLRRDTPIVDPITGELLGLQVLDIGTTSIVAAPGEVFADEDVKTLEVTRMTEEVRVADRLLPIEEGIVDAFYQPKAPDFDIENGFMVNVHGCGLSPFTDQASLSILFARSRAARLALLVPPVRICTSTRGIYTVFIPCFTRNLSISS